MAGKRFSNRKSFHPPINVYVTYEQKKKENLDRLFDRNSVSYSITARWLKKLPTIKFTIR